MYSPILIDHFRAPRNVGMMRNADAVGEAEDGSCGDLARFYLRIERGRVTEARFQTYGCGPSIAASSVATELVRGRAVDAMGELTPDAVEPTAGKSGDEVFPTSTALPEASTAMPVPMSSPAPPMRTA